MIIVKLAGGLGNQMFQYAAGLNLAIKHRTKLKLDLSFLNDRTPRKDFVYRDYDLDIFNINVDFATESEIVKFGKYRLIGLFIYAIKQIINPKLPKYVCENYYNFDPNYFEIQSNSYIEGYWQSECYFKQIETVIRNEFTFREGLNALGKNMAKKILSVNSICLNVRRGDYVSIKSTNMHHGVCEKEYFYRGISIIAEKISNPYFFIFSDDIEWCQNNLMIDYPNIIVDNSYAGTKYGQKLHLMTLCKHFIISNSSFAWWAAWLCRNPEKIVISPLLWYRNPLMNTQYLVPKFWIRI